MRFIDCTEIIRKCYHGNQASFWHFSKKFRLCHLYGIQCKNFEISQCYCAHQVFSSKSAWFVFLYHIWGNGSNAYKIAPFFSFLGSFCLVTMATAWCTSVEMCCMVFILTVLSYFYQIWGVNIKLQKNALFTHVSP